MGTRPGAPTCCRHVSPPNVLRVSAGTKSPDLWRGLDRGFWVDELKYVQGVVGKSGESGSQNFYVNGSQDFAILFFFFCKLFPFRAHSYNKARPLSSPRPKAKCPSCPSPHPRSISARMASPCWSLAPAFLFEIWLWCTIFTAMWRILRKYEGVALHAK